MNAWTSGYVADIGYTYGYYTELNPQRVSLVFAQQGLVAPEVRTACELGFGQGVSANIHAAASPVAWWGTDFNPSQAAFAQSMARASGSGAQLFDESFTEFCARSDLPDFDYIGLHGIWSWISSENRTVIVDFVRRKLKVGGVLYVSYNTLPGWASFSPLRHLLTQHAEKLGTQGGGIVSRIDGALEFALRLMTVDPAYARANPKIVERLANLKDQPRHYLAHEYFNRDWHPMHFATMAEWLAPAKLQFACSAHPLDLIDGVNLTKEQQEFLAEIPDPLLRQTSWDFMVNQQFRRDYWVKGSRKLSALEQVQALRKEVVILNTPRVEVELKVKAAAGEAKLQEAIYNPILDLMGDYHPRTLGELEAQLKQQLNLAQLVQAVIVLTGAGHVSTVRAAGNSEKTSSALNSHLIEKARGNADVGFLASPVTGGGVGVSRFQQLFLQSIAQGRKAPEDWAKDTWALIESQGQRLIKDGLKLDSAEKNLKEITNQAKIFADKQLPILKALAVA